MILLDTSVLIGYPAVRLPEGELAFSAISYAELSFGIAIQTDPAVRARRRNRLNLLDQFGNDWLPFDRNAAAGYADLAAHVHSTRPSHSRSKDIMLVGQALSLGAAFATQNPKDFELVAHLVQIVVPERREK